MDGDNHCQIFADNLLQKQLEEQAAWDIYQVSLNAMIEAGMQWMDCINQQQIIMPPNPQIAGMLKTTTTQVESGKRKATTGRVTITAAVNKLRRFLDGKK